MTKVEPPLDFHGPTTEPEPQYGGSRRQALCITLMTAAVVLFGLSRFLHLGADFPGGITWSGVLYTDEGWYSNAAVRHVLDNRWYVPGDFNPMVFMPVWHLIQSAVFSAFGMSLVSARATAVVFSLLSLVLTFLVAHKNSDTFSSLLAALLLATNFIYFAYSRLALLEVCMTAFVLLALAVTYFKTVRRDSLAVCLSAAVFSVAVLTKTTAVFALPAVLYMAGTRHATAAKRLPAALLFSVVFLVIVGGFHLTTAHLFPEDFHYFKTVNINDRLSPDLLSILAGVVTSFSRASFLDPLIYPVTMICALIFLLFSPDFRNNSLVRAMMLWLCGHFVFLSITSYNPPRYYVPLIIPLLILFALISTSIRTRLHRWIHITFIVVVSYSIAINGYATLDYLRHPDYSFINMAHSIKEITETRGSCDGHVLLAGDPANSISIETGLPSISATVGTRDLKWKLEAYGPRYFVSLGIDVNSLRVIGESYRIEHVAEYDVFGNYLQNKKVHLFELHDKT